MKVRILTLFFAIFALSAAAFAQGLDTAKLDKFFDALAAKNKVMGSAAVARDGKVIYSRAVGYGAINDKEKTPATTSTKYRIGSITKMFTAVMIFQLIDEGKLKLNDTLDKFYPDVPNAKTITVAQLLGHRSGLHNFTGDAEYLTYMTKPKTQSEMVAIISRSKPDFEPGARAEYSNSNYVLLGYIIEKVSKKTYPAVLKENITSKIGLTDTYVGGKTDPGNNESLSYEYLNGWKPSTETDLSVPGGAGAMLSTPTDLTKFAGALFNLKLVSEKSLNQMKTITDNYGMGMFQYPVYGKTGYGHNGGVDGYNSILVYVPEEKLAVSFISNGLNYVLNDIALALFAVSLNEPFTIPTFETFAVREEELEKYTGVYSSAQIALKISITKEKGQLFGQATGQASFPLEPSAKDTFKFDKAGVIMEFDPEKNQLTLKQGGQLLLFTRDKQPPSKDKQ